MKTLFLIPFLFFGTILNAQDFSISDDITLLRYLSRPSSKVAASGSPYVDETFLPIRISSFKNQLFSARYNAYNGEMEVIPAIGKAAIILNKDEVVYEVHFTTLKKTYKTYTYFDKTEKTDFLVNIIILENISLLKKEEVKFIPESKAQSSYQQDKPAQFKRLEDAYFIKIKNTDIIALPTKKKSIANLFPKHSKNILSYIKSSKIKLFKEKDLIQLMNFLNVL